jgi:hypothetical protein
MRESLSLAVILSPEGPFDLAALAGLPGARLIRLEIARGETATCAALTLAHQGSREVLRAAVGRWAAGHGWRATVAPLTGPG